MRVQIKTKASSFSCAIINIKCFQLKLEIFLIGVLKPFIQFQIEDPEDNWPAAAAAVAVDNNQSATSAQGLGPPPAKKKKYRAYDIALENTGDGGKFIYSSFFIGVPMSFCITRSTSSTQQQNKRQTKCSQ